MLPLRLCGKTTLAVLLHAVDALDFRGRSLVLRKEQRILVFIVLKHIFLNTVERPVGILGERNA